MIENVFDFDYARTNSAKSVIDWLHCYWEKWRQTEEGLRHVITDSTDI